MILATTDHKRQRQALRHPLRQELCPELCQALADAGEGDPQERFAEWRIALGTLLGLDGPVPSDVLMAALASDSYARGLLRSRRHPAALKVLLASPPRRAAAKDVEATEALPRVGPLALVGQGARALLAWSRSGFTTTDPDERQRRIEACLRCPYHQPPTAGDGQHDLGTCGHCGCPLSRKVAMSSESCPAHSPQTPEHNRWGQPIASSPQHHTPPHHPHGVVPHASLTPPKP